MRLFIAIPLPGDIMKKVCAYEQQLQDNGSTGRFIPRGNHHITLRFIGESSALADIAEAMREAVKDARPFTLKLGGYGQFTHGGGRTGYLGVTGDTSELFRVHETLETALSDRGLGRGRGKLQPHITLGRALENVTLPEKTPEGSLRVNSIVLYESVAEKGRMVYMPLHTERF